MFPTVAIPRVLQGTPLCCCFTCRIGLDLRALGVDLRNIFSVNKFTLRLALTTKKVSDPLGGVTGALSGWQKCEVALVSARQKDDCTQSQTF